MLAIKSLWMVGCGKMGQALYQGWANGELPIGAIMLIDPSPQPDGFELRPTDQWLAKPFSQGPKPDILVIAVKPQLIADALPHYKNFIRPDTLVISIAAGTSIETITSLLNNPEQPVVRVMPNTPAMVGMGISGAFANDAVTMKQCDSADQLLTAVGDVLWLDNEDQMHAVTALSGSGPAYVFALIEAMTAAGIAQGLDEEMATLLARQTVIGSAALADTEVDVPAAILRQNVTSPGGTTAAGLDILQGENGLSDLLEKTVAAAATRSRELGR